MCRHRLRTKYQTMKNEISELFKCNYVYSDEKDAQEEILRKISYSKKVVSKPEKVALIIPPSSQIPTPGREFLVTGSFEGFTCVATLIKKMGHQLQVIDCRLKKNVKDFVIRNIKDASIIGIATYMDSFNFLQRITALIKEKYSDKLIFLGGSLVSSLPEIMLSQVNADCAILGEAELTLIEFFHKYFGKECFEYKNIKGMAYKNNGKIKINLPRPQIKNLDNLPLLDYSIWPNHKSIIDKGQILISSMRGCPMECSFCFKTIPALRMKSLERFEQEIVHLKEATKFNYTWLNDLTFNIDEERAICIGEIMQKYSVKYHCFARVTKFSKALAKKLRKTGCLGVWFGMESYNQDVLDYNGKNVSIDDINRVVRICDDIGLAARGLFIVGLYGETEDSLKEMLTFIKQKTFLPLVKYLVPFPGTALYKYALQSKKITDIVSFLRMLSRRKIRDHDDKIINLTGLQDEVLRYYFRQIWDITNKREKFFAETEKKECHE